MAEKSIIIGEQEVRMRATALIPRLYRFKFGRDMISDMNTLQKNFNKVRSLRDDATEEEIAEAQLSVLDLTIFENVAWLMARQADPEIPDNPDEWLETIDGVFSIYEVLPVIIDLWQWNTATTSVPRKK